MRGLARFLLVFACALLATSAPALTIKTQPKTIMVNAGSTATFNVVVTNGTATAYQWYVGTTALQDGTNTSGAIISGSQTANLTIENVTTNINQTYYKVVVSGGTVPLTSAAVRLTVLQGTLVKFDTALGPIIVELFDHDKPVTIQNFVRYAYGGPTGGAYLNTFFSRLEKNFVLQGGGFSPIATSPSDLFTNEYYIADRAYVANYTSQPAFPGFVKNESHIGPRIRNTFGTIAMATVSGFPDSARSEFFFNLGDNSSGTNNLDELNGGYTVFGRVVQGLDVLNAFNNLPDDHILSHTVNDTTFGSRTFPTLPTQTNDPNNVHVSDLYYTSISLATRPVIDLIRPTARITYPYNGAKLTNGDFTLTGTASDNLGLSSVLCVNALYVSIGPDPLSDQIAAGITVNGTTNWSAAMHLHPGPWALKFRITDGFGNWTEVSENITVTAPLAVQQVGNGTISPNYNNQYLAPETKYTMTATPKAGQLFAYWSAERNGQPWNFPYGNWSYVQVVTNGTTNLVLSGPSLGYQVTTPTLGFTMYSNLTVTANFVSNYFPVVQGNYYGLMAPPDHNDITVSNAGVVKISSASVGSFSGTLSMLGKAFPFFGKWDYAGNANGVVIKRTGMSNLVANLSIDLSNNLGKITGTISGPDWQSVVDASKSVTKLTTGTTPSTGNYVMILPAQSANSDLGDSFATVSVSSAGSMMVSGTMADNTSWTESVGVDTNGNWPLFASLYGGSGLVIGLEQFGNTSVARWYRPAIATPYYSSAFQTGPFINPLAKYVRPPANSTYTLRLGGNTLTEVDYSLRVSSAGQFTVVSGPGKYPSLVLTTTSGAISGTWTDANNGHWTLKGIFQEPSAGGTGFILGPNGQTGYLHIDPL